jgi:translation initiation factor 2B subunit (eIF-2B alpha/beta/delta family)
MTPPAVSEHIIAVKLVFGLAKKKGKQRKIRETLKDDLMNTRESLEKGRRQSFTLRSLAQVACKMIKIS